ncbi:MAG: hypothetical protein ACP5R5_06780 [Armatimonadota bacterium]
MKNRAVWLIVVLSCSIAWAQEEKPPMDLPVYPGGTSSMEINITPDELIQMLQAMLPMAGDRVGNLADVVSPERVSKILKDVKRIEYLQVDIPQRTVKMDQIAAFYARKLPAGTWSRVIWLDDERSGVTAVYSQPNTEQIYGFRVSTANVDGKIIKQAIVLKIEGRIDYVEAIRMGAALGAVTLQQAAEPK